MPAPHDSEHDQHADRAQAAAANAPHPAFAAAPLPAAKPFEDRERARHWSRGVLRSKAFALSASCSREHAREYVQPPDFHSRGRAAIGIEHLAGAWCPRRQMMHTGRASPRAPDVVEHLRAVAGDAAS